jgi:hypothetical protein
MDAPLHTGIKPSVKLRTPGYFRNLSGRYREQQPTVRLRI